MDAKEAIELLRDNKREVFQGKSWRGLSVTDANRIANLIERLDAQAKMGAAAEKALIKDGGFGIDCIETGFDDKCCLVDCAWQDFCRLRKGVE